MKIRAHFLLLVCLPISAAAIAGPAEDALARSVELQKSDRAQEERIARLEAQMQNQGLLNLLNQVEALKTEVARLRGIQEEQAYRLENADKRSKDLFADLDERVREIATRPVASPADAIRLQPSQTLIAAPPAPVDAEAEARAYASAHGFVKSAKYKEAVTALQGFLDQYPDGGLAANAVYWLGFSHVGLSDFKAGIAGYQRLLRDFPNSPKVPDAMLSLARAQVQTRDIDAARATLYQLFAKHPQSKAAENGKKLLATLN